MTLVSCRRFLGAIHSPAPAVPGMDETIDSLWRPNEPSPIQDICLVFLDDFCRGSSKVTSQASSGTGSSSFVTYRIELDGYWTIPCMYSFPKRVEMTVEPADSSLSSPSPRWSIETVLSDAISSARNPGDCGMDPSMVTGWLRSGPPISSAEPLSNMSVVAIDGCVSLDLMDKFRLRPPRSAIDR